MEPKIAQAFLNAIHQLRGKIDLTQLANAIQSGDINEVMRILSIDSQLPKILEGADLPPNVQSFRDAVQATFAAGTNAGVASLPTAISVEMSFNLNESRSSQLFEFLRV